jgi:cell division protein FtsN
MGRWMILLVVAAVLPASGQVLSTATNAITPAASTVTVDVKVLAIPSSGLRELGLYFPDGASEGERPGGFAIVLPAEEAAALPKDPDTIAIHSLRITPTAGTPAKFRVEARTAVTASFPVDPPYFEVSLGFEVTSKSVSEKNVQLSTASVVQIRRGPGALGSVAPLLFETQPIKHEVQLPEGRTILLGGFFTAADASRLPDIPPNPESPMLHYVLSKGPKKATDHEVVVLLSPRVVEAVGKVPASIPRITETVTPQAPPQQAPLKAPQAPPEQAPLRALQAPPEQAPLNVAAPAEVAPVIASQPPRPVDLQPVISALVTTPEVVSPPFVAMVTPRPAPPVAKLAPAPLARRDRSAEYTVQVGAFKSSVKAEALAGKLEKQFAEVFVAEVPEADTPYRVRIGHLSNLAAARQLKQKLTKQGIDSFIVLPSAR